MSKCDYCPSLFHTSSQCKFKPKVLARTPSEELSKSRIEDYFVFSDNVPESQMKKLVSPFSFSIDSLADKDGFYIDKDGSKGGVSIRNHSRELLDRSRDQSDSLARNYGGQRKSSFVDQRGNRASHYSKSGSSGSYNDRLDSPAINDRPRYSRSVNDNSRLVNDRLDNSRSVNDRLDKPRYTQLSSNRVNNVQSINKLSFSTQHDQSENGSSRLEKVIIPGTGSRKDVVMHVTENKRFKGDDYGHKRFDGDSDRDSNRNLKGNYQRYAEPQRDIYSQGSRRNPMKNSQDSPKVQVSNRMDGRGASTNSSNMMSAQDERGSNFTRIIDSDSNDDSMGVVAKRISPVKEVVTPRGLTKSAEVEIIEPSLNKTGNELNEKLSSNRSVEMADLRSYNNSPSGSTHMTIDSVSLASPKESPKESISKHQEIPEERVNLDSKHLSYHHRKYELKRRNAYAELDASISLEISKMNSTISELELVLFETAPNLVEDASCILNRLKTQKDFFKDLKDTYLKQLYDIEDQESAFIKENHESVSSNARKRNASEADLVSENAENSEKTISKISLNSSPSSKKDRINQEYVSSIFEESFDGFPSTPKEESQIYNTSSGLKLMSSILDGKPRSALFPHDKVIDSLDGILFSTTLENKLQIWDIPTFSPIKSVSFLGETEKTDKVSLPEDMCWVSSNSILISSKSTDKVQDQPWNNLTLLYDLRRSAKTSGIKYKILNFKEHGHGSISAIKGLSSTNDKSTHWVTGGFNKKIFYWTIGDLTSDTVLDSKVLMNEHTSAVTAFHYCTHKEIIYSGGLDGKVFGFNLDGVILSSFSIKPKRIRNIHQIGSNTSTLLISAIDREGEFLIYDSLKNAPVMQFGSKKELTNADEKFERVRSSYQNSAVHPNGYLVCMGDHNTSKINLWDIRRPNIPLQFDVHDKGQTERGKSKYLSLVLGFHAIGGKQYLYSLGSDKRIVRIDLNSVF